MTTSRPAALVDDELRGNSFDAVMRSACQATGAEFAIVSLMIEPDQLLVHAAHGPLADELVGNLIAVDESAVASVVRTGRALLVADYPRDGGATPGVRARVGCMLVVALRDGDRVEGTLAVGRLAGSVPFEDAELDVLDSLVRYTDTTREIDRARQERRTAQLIEDRWRVSANLSDHVVQELYAAAMSLDMLMEALPEPAHRDALCKQVDALDATTRRIRAIIAESSRGGEPSRPKPLPRRLLAIIDSLTPALGCTPTASFVGPVETAVHPDLGEDVEAVLRDALTSVAMRGGARSVQICIVVDRGRLCLDVLDDAPHDDVSGQVRESAAMRQRAARHRGALTVLPSAGDGTHLRWTAWIDPVG